MVDSTTVFTSTNCRVRGYCLLGRRRSRPARPAVLGHSSASLRKAPQISVDTPLAPSARSKCKRPKSCAALIPLRWIGGSAPDGNAPCADVGRAVVVPVSRGGAEQAFPIGGGGHVVLDKDFQPQARSVSTHVRRPRVLWCRQRLRAGLGRCLRRGGGGLGQLAQHLFDGWMQIGVHMIVTGLSWARVALSMTLPTKIDSAQPRWCESRC